MDEGAILLLPPGLDNQYNDDNNNDDDDDYEDYREVRMAVQYEEQYKNNAWITYWQ